MVLLDTRLRLPVARRELVARERLLGRMPSKGERLPRLVLVSAPAGFGKTTLLTQWANRWQGSAAGAVRRVAWVSLNVGEGDARTFLESLVAAVRVAVDLEADEHASVGSGMVSLVNAIDGLGGELVIALDDYHVIESAEVHAAVTFLLENLPANAAIAMTTRADPPLPIARLRARGELLELRAADLRFTQEEANAFLIDVMGLDIGADHVASLGERTEGWVTGIQLAAVALRAGADVARFVELFAGTHRFVLDYLVEEVLDQQNEQVRRFLLDTSILDRLTGPLCDAVTGRQDGHRMLEELESANLFVVPLDEDRRWYRYHQLFADALRARLAAEDPHRSRAVHAAAARWHEMNRRPQDAVQHAVAAQDFEYAADLVEQALPEASRRRQDRLVLQWLRGLPDGLVRERPVLNVTAAWGRLGAGNVAEAGARLDEAARVLAEMPDDRTSERDDLRQLPMTIAMYRAAIAQARGDPPEVAVQARTMLELAGPDDHLVRGAGSGFLALSAWAEGDIDTARDTFTEAVRSLHSAGNLADELGGTVVLAELALAQGSPVEAERLYERALATAREHPEVALPVTGDLHVGLAGALCECGDLTGATAHLRAARELGEVASMPENRHRWYVAMAALRRAEGDLEAAATNLDHARLLYLPGFFPETRPLPALRARIDIVRGRLDLAEGWAREARPTGDGGYLDECNQVTFARLLIATRRAATALDLLGRLRPDAERQGRGGSLIEIDMLQALAHHAEGALDAAMPPLTRALESGVPAGYVRIFLDEGEEMSALLAVAQHRSPATAAIAALRTNEAQGPKAAAEVLPEPLSDRELQVLSLLATELTGPEIARRLFVSVNTLRTHTRHIFTKLDVTTRARAVRRARDLGLV
ncbi:LuxR C-terminal-related transcriptional regulator [Nocardioides sp. NPDC047086]|uniref:LuxR C-terminal-related transcriptional regulator n=1 Tax=Nocardioides sp. NPDC047086 TaxID=3154810 RepID=UPI0033E6ECEC